MSERDISFVCPRCASTLSADLKCTNCDAVFEKRAGIYRFLLPERHEEVCAFLEQYRLVREREGYSSYTADEYRTFPYVQAGNQQADVWRVRRNSYHRLVSSLGRNPLLILDLGAGNGWLSHRLARLGHDLVAVDWLDDEHDGLGAYRHYHANYTCVQADFDALPFRTSQFDVVIFNASLHYSPSLENTLRKARGILKPGGSLFVLDSPTFSSYESGQRMLKEQLDYLHSNYAIRDAIQPGVGFLTREGMLEFRDVLGLAFQFYPAHGAPLWTVKRWWGGVKNRREPAAFGVWAGTLL